MNVHLFIDLVLLTLHEKRQWERERSKERKGKKWKEKKKKKRKRETVLIRAGVNPEILKNRKCCNLLNYNWSICKSAHFWNENESENPFLVSILPQILIFWENGKNNFIG